MRNGRNVSALAVAEVCPGDGELAYRAKTGDTAAFGELVERYLKRAYAIAYRIVGQRQDAEDLVQEAFMAAFRRFETFDVKRPFAPWLFRILINRGLNQRKAQSLRAVQELPAGLAAREAGPDVVAERAELRTRVRGALDALPRRQRVLMELVELEGFTPSQAAELLGISPATARWHLHTARGALRLALAARPDT